MTLSRITTIVLGTALLTTWLVSAAVTRHRDEPQLVSQRPTPQQPATTADDLQIQTARLRARLNSTPAPRRSPRNPFRFGGRETFESATRRLATIEAGSVPEVHPSPTLAAPAAPPLKLIGIASDPTPCGVSRTAALAVAGEVVLVRAGDEILGRYRVTAISDDVVEFDDLLGGPPLRLALR
jgi:hypothetical protein